MINKNIAQSILDEYCLDIKITNFEGKKIDPPDIILDLKKRSVFVQNMSKTKDIYIVLKLKKNEN